MIPNMWSDNEGRDLSIYPAGHGRKRIKLHIADDQASKDSGFHVNDLKHLDEIIAHLTSLRAEVFGAPKRASIEDVLTFVTNKREASRSIYAAVTGDNDGDYDTEMENGARVDAFDEIAQFINTAPAPGGKEE